MVYKCTVTYDGSGYSGFQIQSKRKTIQGELEKAISIITRTNVRIYAASRTDAGVHAIGQVFHFTTYMKLLEKTMKRAINDRLPPDIRITQVQKVSPSFHSRYSSIAKVYDYYFDLGEYNPLFQRYRYYCPYDIDIELMVKASKMFIGKHNFVTFSKGKEIENPVRTIESIEFFQKGLLYRVRIRGNGFMHNMIRILLAMLIEVGRKKITIEELKHRFELKDRKLAPKVLPASGLFLIKVEFREDKDIDDPYDEIYDEYDEYAEYNEQFENFTQI